MLNLFLEEILRTKNKNTNEIHKIKGRLNSAYNKIAWVKMKQFVLFFKITNTENYIANFYVT